MSSKNQGVSLTSSAETPMKQKRGDYTPATPESDNLKRNKQSEWISDPASSDMLGQMVSGVIEGSFDAGYVLHVKVGDTNTHLRGLVFLPGLFAPITNANDVAPHAKMHKRKDIPIPFVNLHGHLHVLSPSGKNDASNRHDRGLHMGLEPGASVAGESQFASILIPPASNLPINEAGLPLRQKVMQEQSSDSGLHNEKAVGQHQSLQGFEAFKQMKGPSINVEATKASELSAEFAATLQATETINLKPQIQYKALSSELKPQALIHDHDTISLDIGNNQTPQISESETQAMACDAGINMFGKQASSRQDTQSELGQKYMDGLFASDDVTTSATAPCSASMTGLPVMICGADTIPFEPKSGAEESVLPTMVVPEVNSSLVTTANTYSVESNAKDATPPPHS
ncbi:hypothetical protein ES319_A06G160600v1 [Gossypium barbadense]|uniref:AT hook motif-containing protein n=2 Tax=Gossypium TaxID=3633 RepID=A0A2P5YWT8_GOSBA|nr:hypothetical protein ES319_A06G160600v1 [Gossypium barbadense]PPS20013.1 hypothetical protein GOBAR_AA00568 [Gossypium barbadense]TYH13986.1 hypothetical protein ES288_A06G182500v1 [Gossypium darwinii]